MDYFYSTNAADLTPLKTQLVDLVSSCLMKEPPYEAVRPDQLPAPTSAATAAGDGAPPPAAPQPANDGAAVVAQMRELVHLVSRQDGEFVLKLALYTRHTLHLRSSPNYLVALCAREPNCLAFLLPYMEKIVVLPSDWLAIANFAYFYDCDAAHDYSRCLTVPPPLPDDATSRSTTTAAAQRSGSSRGSAAGRTAPSAATDTSQMPAKKSRRKEKKAAAAAAEAGARRSYLPAALRASLVHCFKKFTPFQLAKYDNEGAEHRAHRQERRRRLAGQRRVVVFSDSDDSGSDEDSESSDDAGTTKQTASAPSAPRRQRRMTFTYKLLIRVLHITQPAFLVCCLLGKRYPADLATFKKMGLHLTDASWRPPAATAKPESVDGAAEEAAGPEASQQQQPFCVFSPSLSGSRMRLPVPQTWETQLSKNGNKGRVWDELVAANAVPYMALLRNLRNILTRTCSAATHKKVLEKLVDEQQVAASQQLPYRFYSAYLAVKEVASALPMLYMYVPRRGKSMAEEEVQKEKVRSQRLGRRYRGGSTGTARGVSSGRGRGRGGSDPVGFYAKVAADLERTRVVQAGFENPQASNGFLGRYLPQYLAAVDSAISTAARLNVIPIRGTSVVILCLSKSLWEPMTAMGAAAEVASIQRKIDVAAVLIAMLLRSCEQCIVLLYCYDEYVVFREDDWLNPLLNASEQRGTKASGDNSSNSSDDDDSNAEYRERQRWLDRNGSGGSAAAAQSVSESPVAWHAPSSQGSSSSSSSSSSESAFSDEPRVSTAEQPARPPRSFMKLVEALEHASSTLLKRKTAELLKRRQKAGCLATTFSMFAPGAGAQFPYAFLDEVIERAMRVESLLVFDEGVHRSYADMNCNAPAFGDLPTYLSRLRRVSSPDLVYVGVNLKASSPPSSQGGGAGKQGGAPAAAQEALRRAEVKQRFSHRNDVLLTGFSDSILRLVAERVGGGALSVVERAAETYQVARFTARASQEAWMERAKALKIVSALREGERQAARQLGEHGPPEAAEDQAGSAARAGSASRSGGQALRPAYRVDEGTTTLLPSFDAAGKANLTAATWDGEWGHRARRSERELQQLTGSSAGLSASHAPTTASDNSSSGSRGQWSAASGAASLPSIRRLFSKRSTVDGSAATEATEEARGSSSGRGHGSGHTAGAAEEAAWLVPQGKHVSPISHPQPFISLVKLLSASPATAEHAAVGPASTVATDTPAQTAGLAGAHKMLQGGPQRSGASSPVPAGAVAARSASQRRKAARGDAAALESPAVVVRRLITSYRVCRFFVSSTFLDMNSERNAITLDIFPRLRRWAAEAGLKVTLLEVDLRWGIPAVATTRNLSTSVCLNEVSRCSPFFLGMLGARYGSCPPTPLQLVVDEDVDEADYDWMTTLTDPHVSVTELEMRHAIFNTRRRLGQGAATAPTALFFARDYDQLMASFAGCDAAVRRVYEGDTPHAASAIAALKRRIADSGCHLVSYSAAYTRAGPLARTGTATAAPEKASTACGDGSRSSGVGCGSAAAVPPTSMTQALLEDDLGRWAVRGGRVLDAVGPPADSPSAFAGSRLPTTDEPRRLTSLDVPLDMGDFSQKMFAELQRVICQVCGVDLSGTAGEAAELHGEAPSEGLERRAGAPAVSSALPTAVKATTTAAVAVTESSADLYETLLVAQSEYARKLSALYAAPGRLLEQLASFAMTGTLDGTASPSAARTAAAAAAPGTDGRFSAAVTTNQKGQQVHLPHHRDLDGSKRHNSAPVGHGGDGSGSSAAPRQGGPGQQPSKQDGQSLHGRRAATQSASPADPSSILLVEGSDGDGKSSTLAALTERILLPIHRAAATAAADSHPLLFYSAQAGDDSVRSLLFFLAASYRAIFHLYAELTVRESDSVEQLLLVLDQAYATLHRRYDSAAAGPPPTTATAAAAGPAALVVILDGLDKSSEAEELVSRLGTILHPLAAPHIRFLVSACPRSPLACALRTRTPAARVVPLPLLSEGERAQLVRLHLAAYGKLLEESFSADELQELLRKAGAGRPSRLTSAITYLRLFSTFDTLREDIRSLPSTSTQLYVLFFQQLQQRFDGPTCRLVLTLLLLRHPVGGVMEYNLYRLVSNVAVASRLVALLRGICLGAHNGRLFITSAAFLAAVARTYLPYSSDYQSAQERVLVAELRYQPVDMTVDEQAVRQALRRTREAVEQSAADPLAQCPFNPARYAPRELLGVLQGSVQASRLDVTAALVCYLPFLECLLISPRMLAQLVSLLSSIMHATREDSDAAAAAERAYSVLDSVTEAEVADGDGVAAAAHVPLQWRHYRSEVRRLSSVLDFLHAHYHILLRQPGLLRQCVWNSVAKSTSISLYDTNATTQLRAAVQQAATSCGNAAAAAVGAEQSDALLGSTAAPPSGAVLASAWVHWLNLRQHGSEMRELLTTASPQPIRCMAVSPDGAEVALGTEDGFVRRVRAADDDEGGHDAFAAGSGGRSRPTSTLRHEAAVTVVHYVPALESVPPGLSGRGAAAASRSAAPVAPHLLASGCARGFIYVWNLDDNSLLQRGTGHLRGISGLACHPLQPTVLCSCSHDSLVMLWNLCGTRPQLQEEIAAAVALRQPKYPAGSPERRKQQQRVMRGGAAAAAVFQSSLASRSTAGRPAALTPLVAFHTERQHRTPVSCVDFHRSGEVMASGSWDGAVLLYNTHELQTPQPAVPPARRMLAAPGRFVKTRHGYTFKNSWTPPWRVRHGPEYRRVAFKAVQFDLGSPVRALSFSSSLAVSCVVGCHNGAVLVIDHASYAVVARWGGLHTAPITCVTFSPDTRCVASADERGVVRLTHNGVSGSAFATLNGHQGAVTGLRFRGQSDSLSSSLASSQHVLLTAGEDRTMQAWRVDCSTGPEAKASTQCLTTSHSAAVTAVATSRDGRMLVTGSADGTAIVFCAADDDSVGGWPELLRAAEAAALREERPHVSLRHAPRTAPLLATGGVEGGGAAGRPMAASFVLRHDECRITCVRFALQDSRIVVGVVFGLVYVWSSAPGLNRIEGRLLLRVRVPQHGLYPVVSLGVREAPAAARSAEGRGVAPRASRDTSALWPGDSGTPQATVAAFGVGQSAASLSASATAEGMAFVSEDVGSALVTAVCANGDVAVLKLLSDGASKVMVADEDRRRQLQHQRHHHPQHVGSRERRDSGAFKKKLSEVGGTRILHLPPPSSQAVAGFGGLPLGQRMLGQSAPTAAFPFQHPAAGRADSKMQRLPLAGDSVMTPARVAGCLPPHADLMPQGGRTLFIQTVRPPPRRRLLDRRATKLQRLLMRCQRTEAELKGGFLLDLHRHRLQWAGTTDAAEITAVVWLGEESPKTAGAARGQESAAPATTLPAAVGGAADSDGRHRRLALVVTQRGLFLLLSNGHESALSASLHIHVPHTNPGSAAAGEAQGVTAAAETGEEEGVAQFDVHDSGDDALTAEERPTDTTAADTDHRAEVAVDVAYLLEEEEYFTAASVAVAVSCEAEPSATAVDGPQCEERAEAPVGVSGGATAPHSPLLHGFVVAVTTSCGEVLMLRIEVPRVPRKAAAATLHHATAAAQLTTQVLPFAKVQLCQRLSFARGATATATAEGRPRETSAEVSVGGAAAGAARRDVAAPLASTVQLSPLPRLFCDASLPDAESATVRGESAGQPGETVEQVALVAGCSDGSTRVWAVPTSPLAARRSRTAAATAAADVPVGCFFCTNPVSVVSSLLATSQASPTAAAAAGGTAAAALPQPPRWVVGDSLGNVYQLQLELDAPGGVATLLRACAATASTEKAGKALTSSGGGGGALRELAAAADPDVRPWVSSLHGMTRLMSDSAVATTAGGAVPSAFASSPLTGIAGGGADSASGAWASHTLRTPAEWLSAVDMSVPVAATLLQRRQTAPPTHAQTATVAAAVPAGNAPLRTKSTAAAAAGSQPAETWSILPDVPTVLRPSAMEQTQPTGGEVASATDTPASALALAVPSGRGFGLAAPPAPLSSFGSQDYRCELSTMMTEGSRARHQIPTAMPRFDTPVTDLLAAYRRPTPDATYVGASPKSAVPQQVVHVAVPSSPRAPLHVGAADAQLRAQQTANGEADAHHEDEEGEEGDYFAILYQRGPASSPAGSAAPAAEQAESRRRWQARRHEVLKEAMRVQGYNKAARAALKAYQQQVAADVGRMQ